MPDYRTLEDLSPLAAYHALAVDTETDGLSTLTAQLVGVSFCGEPHRAFWLPADRLDPAALSSLFRGKTLVLHNAKFDLNVLERHGVDVSASYVFDTMLAAHLLDENRPKGLKWLAKELLGEENVTEYDELTPQLSLFGHTASLADYACADADHTFRLYRLFREELDRLPTLAAMFRRYEVPVMHVIRRMERVGVLLDTDHLARVGDAYRARRAELEGVIFGLAGRPFMLTSPVELASVLYDDLALTVHRETRTGNRSVDQATLERLEGSHPIISPLREHRELTTLLNVFVEKLPQIVSPITGRVHSNFNQVGTVTGRISSNDPNLQNIPKDATIRSAFVAPEGRVLIDADFSQIELRCVAHYAQDRRMMEAFERDIDLHRKTIADIIGKPVEEVTPEERALAKAVNFGLIYGMGARRLASSTGIPLSKAEAFIRAYFDTYEGVRRFRDTVIAYAEEHHQVTNLYGRRRRFAPGRRSPALNALIQSTAADICRDKMIALDAELPDDVQMLLQVHDEILFEAPAERVDETVVQIVQIMESPIQDAKGRRFRVPIRVEVGVGRNWGEAKR
ncbi:hypothetical protein FJZ36_14490 [Candidatus Poribacteria bacterium]|nr:hypothetical protein [Candidatus Poribacteria bacterium]